MTQVELPQLSLQRYVELLKRRRWQVIPVSLLGLLVGGVVAFLIPRWFVASATLIYQRPPDVTAGPDEDPFGPIVESAKLTIPRAIASTIKTLGWPEGLAADPFVLSENVAAIDARLDVDEANSGKDRQFVMLRVTYRDRDGLRAANLVNTLVATWTSQQIDAAKAQAEAMRAAAADKHRQCDVAFGKFVDHKQHLEREYGIVPGLDPAVQRAASEELIRRRDELGRRLATRRGELAKLGSTLAQLQQLLDETPPRVAPDPALLERRYEAIPEARPLVLELKTAKTRLAKLRPEARGYGTLARYVARVEKALAELPGGPQLDLDAEGRMANPRHAELAAQRARAEADCAAARAELEPEQQLYDQEAARIARLAEGHALYEKLLSDLGEAKSQKEKAHADLVAADERVGRLADEPTVRVGDAAQPPPRPTEPNILVVALLGCIVGLFVATALILLLDVLQGSFKTIDDVERSLPVPVLGGMSHLETAEDRRAALRGRRRVTLLAAAFVVSLTGVVLMFYYDPTRLPPFVRDLLAIVLGAT